MYIQHVQGVKMNSVSGTIATGQPKVREFVVLYLSILNSSRVSQLALKLNILTMLNKRLIDSLIDRLADWLTE